MSDVLATIIIPNYNGARFLSPLLQSLRAQTDRRFEVLVVDDGSSDDGVEIIRTDFREVTLHINERNLGFAGTCNVGIRQSAQPFVALLNNDTTVAPDWFAHAIAAFDDAQVGSVASLVLLAAPPHVIDSAGDVYSVVGGALKRGHSKPREFAAQLSSTCLSACGASAFYRREVLNDVGLLDEAFTSYYEDVDLGLRLAWAGYTCRFAPQSICYHHLSASYSPRGWNYHFNSARNAEIVWQANMPLESRRRHAQARRAFLTLQGMNKMRQGVWRAYAAGRKAGKAATAHIEEKRTHIERIARVSDDEIESRLIKDWFALHVRKASSALDPRGPAA